VSPLSEDCVVLLRGVVVVLYCAVSNVTVLLILLLGIARQSSRQLTLAQQDVEDQESEELGSGS
jgi:hypothetical protein